VETPGTSRIFANDLAGPVPVKNVTQTILSASYS
jgi:hypothetical protein